MCFLFCKKCKYINKKYINTVLNDIIYLVIEMKIALGNDHHGIEIKNRIISYLTERNLEYVNLGCDEVNNVDYVDYASAVCDKVKTGECNLGILICGTGIGMSIAANKVSGIFAAKVHSPREARLCREHNMANVITLAEYTEDLEGILDSFINTLPSTEERHKRRFEKICNLR